MKSHPSPSFCEHCKVYVTPVQHPLRWWLMEFGAWLVVLGIFMVGGSLAPVLLLVPALAMACMIGPFYQHIKDPPHCPLCNRYLPEPRAHVLTKRELPAFPSQPMRA